MCSEARVFVEVLLALGVEELLEALGVEGFFKALDFAAGVVVASFLPTTGAVVGRDGVRLELALGILEPDLATGLVFAPEATGSLLLEDLVTLPLEDRKVVVVVGVAFVGVVLEREDALNEERPDFGFNGRSPLVDLLSRSEMGAKRKTNTNGVTGLDSRKPTHFEFVVEVADTPVTSILPREDFTELTVGMRGPCLMKHIIPRTAKLTSYLLLSLQDLKFLDEKINGIKR